MTSNQGFRNEQYEGWISGRDWFIETLSGGGFSASCLNLSWKTGLRKPIQYRVQLTFVSEIRPKLFKVAPEKLLQLCVQDSWIAQKWLVLAIIMTTRRNYLARLYMKKFKYWPKNVQLFYSKTAPPNYLISRRAFIKGAEKNTLLDDIILCCKLSLLLIHFSTLWWANCNFYKFSSWGFRFISGKKKY